MSRRPTPLSDTHPLSSPLPEVTFTLTVCADADWEVVRLDGREAVCEGFSFTLEVACDDASRDPDALLDAAAELSIARGGHARAFSGVVTAVTDLGVAHRHRRARIVLEPEFVLLGDRVDSRVFVDRTAVEVVAEVLRRAELYIGRVDVHVTRALPRHERLVQYRETDLAFVARWLEREGIAWSVLHDADRGEVLVLTDGCAAWPQTPSLDGAAVPVDVAPGATASVESLQCWELRRTPALSAAIVADHDWSRPRFDPNAGRARPGRRVHRETSRGLAFGSYAADHGHAYAQDDAAAQASLRVEGSRARSGVATAESNVVGVGAGQRLRVERDGDAATWAVIAVVHRGHAPEVLAADHTSEDATDRYANTVECLSTETPFRPQRRTPWPRVSGVELAHVEGPEAGAPCTEFHGRVRVRFDWDERGEAPPESSCWVPVLQTWAGAGYGFTFVPRAGMAVAVEFIGGDPDRPVVAGAIYDGEHSHAEELPRHRSRSGIRTASLDDPRRYNELVFDDETHREEVYLRAQRTLREDVLGDHLASVGHDRTERVAHDHRITVGHDADETVHGMRRALVDGDDVLTTLADRHETVVGRQSTVAGRRSVVVGDVDGLAPAPGCDRVDVALDHLLRAGRDIVLEAEHSITLRVGQSCLVIDRHQVSVYAPHEVLLRNGAHARVEVRTHSVEVHDACGGNLVLEGGFARLNT